MKWRAKYEYSVQFGNPKHCWSIVGPVSGLHLHITDHGEKHAEKYGERYSGGFEIHHRVPPAYMEDQAPSYDDCWLLHCPCWRDGSSLQVSEFWIPLWQADPHDHDRMFEALISDAESRQSEDLTEE